MKVLNFKDFMKKHNLKNDTINENLNYKESIIILYTPEIQKFNQTKDLLL